MTEAFTAGKEAGFDQGLFAPQSWLLNICWKRGEAGVVLTCFPHGQKTHHNASLYLRSLRSEYELRRIQKSLTWSGLT